MYRALCFAGAKPSSLYVDDHLYTPLPVAYLERGVTSLGDDVSDIDVSEGELRGGMRVTYTASGCCVSPVKVVTSSAGVRLGRDDDTAAIKLRRLLCCRKDDEVLLLLSKTAHAFASSLLAPPTISHLFYFCFTYADVWSRNKINGF